MEDGRDRTRRLTDPIRIANCSGFYGDRLSAAREMVEGGPIDVLTGDWLAELTMLILWKAKARNADGGYATTFLTQMEQVLGHVRSTGASRSSPTPAGSTRPGCAERGRARSPTSSGCRRRRRPRRGRRPDATASTGCARSSSHLDTGEPLTADPGQRQRLPRRLGHRRGARRRAPTSSCAPAGSPTPPSSSARRRGGGAGQPTDWDRLAGAVAAGHVIECGAQATGGNFAFFAELRRPDAAARLPDRRGRRRRLVRDHQAPRHRRRASPSTR